jgi:glycerophosphoryl diester phosphodiesterase
MDRVRRIGHKGADAIAPGNTIASFEAAVEVGVDVIEFDVLRPRADFDHVDGWRDAPAGPVSNPGGPLLVAHDWGDAARREPHMLGQALDAFTAPPLDRVEFDCDVKVAGREDELVAAIAERGLTDRAMISTMEVATIREIHRLEPRLRLGWTLPKITRDWTRKRWATPIVAAGLLAFRRGLPGKVRREAPALGVRAIWAYHPVVTARLAAACRESGLDLNAWTVDDAPSIARLVELGATGICTNDPRLLAEP